MTILTLTLLIITMLTLTLLTVTLFTVTMLPLSMLTLNSTPLIIPDLAEFVLSRNRMKSILNATVDINIDNVFTLRM